MVIRDDSRFIGRREALDDLAAIATRASTDGIGSVVVVRGEAGIGKSALIERWLDDPRADGTAILRATADDIGYLRPFGLVADLVSPAPWSPAADELEPRASSAVSAGRAAGEVGGGALLGRVDRFVELIEARLEKPMVLVAEDVHWADQPSLATLEALVSLTIDRPLTILISCRPDTPTGFVVDFLDRLEASGARHIELDRFDDNEVEILVGRLCGGRPSPELLDHVAGASGNPLLIHEFVNGLLEENRLVVRGDTIGLLGAAPPKGLRDLLLGRLAELGEDTRSVVRPAAVLGRRFSVTDLAALCEQSVASLTQPVERALAASLLEEDGASLRFRHDLVREAVYHGVPTSLRAALHLRVARLLSERGASAVVIGAHLILGSDPDDPDAVEWLRRAAREAQGASPAAALEFLDRALDLTGTDPAARLVVQRARLDTLTALSRLDEAVELAEWLLPNAEIDAVAELRTRYAGLLMLRGDGDAALSALSLALEDAGSDLERSQIHAIEALTLMTTGDFSRATAVADQAAAMGRTVGDAVGHSTGLAVAGRIETFDHHYREGLRRGAEAVAVADTDATGFAHRHAPLLYYGLSALDAGRADLASEAIRRGRELAATNDMDWSLPVYAGMSAALNYRRGRLDDAATEAEEGVALAGETASVQAKLWCECILTLVALDRGEVQVAADWFEIADRTWQEGRSPLGTDYSAVARAAVAEARGNTTGAYETLCMAWDLFEAFDTRSCHPILAADLVRLAACVGDTDRVDAAVSAMEQAAERSDIADYRALADRVGGVGRRDCAQLERAVSCYRTLDRPLDLAGSLGDLAICRAVAGRMDDARLARREAGSLYEQLGATGQVHRLGIRLSEVGLAEEERVPPRRRIGWDDLTPSENEIVALLAEGLSNKEIAERRGVSRRTVESQLQRAYAKVGINSRVKLAMEVGRRAMP